MFKIAVKGKSEVGEQARENKTKIHLVLVCLIDFVIYKWYKPMANRWCTKYKNLFAKR